jgi:hypothetical protein
MVATGQVVGATQAHTHEEADVTGLTSALDTLQTDVAGKAATVHTHVETDVTGLAAELDSLGSDVDGKAPLVHAHAIADVTALQAGLDAKAASVHAHDYASGGGLEPEDHGLLAWTMDPMQALGTATISAAQVLHVMKLRTRRAITVTDIMLVVTAAGVGLTANRCFAALYDAAGNLLSQTADQSAAWLSAGLKTMPLAVAQQIPAGNFYVGLMYAGTTSPTLPRGSNVNTATVNMNTSGLGLRSFTVGAALTAPPASIVGGAGLFTSYVLGVK